MYALADVDIFFLNYKTDRFVHLDLPSEAKTEATRFRWWQPSHNGHGHDQWAIDEVLIGQYEHLDTLHDDFDVRLFFNWVLAS